MANDMMDEKPQQERSNKKKKLDHVLFMLLYRLFSFILIGEVFNFRLKVYFFPTYYFKY